MPRGVSLRSKKKVIPVIEEPSKIYNEYNLDIPLFHHQKLNVKSMRDMEFNQQRKYVQDSRNVTIHSKLGILADRVGSGKTLTVIAHIASSDNEYKLLESDTSIRRDPDCPSDAPLKTILVDWPSQRYAEHHFSFSTVETVKLIYYPVNVIVINESLVQQWEKEISHSNLKFYSISKKKHIEDVQYFIHKYHVILVTTKLYKLFVTQLSPFSSYDTFSKICFKRVIFDELNLNESLPPLIALYYWIVSATVPSHFDTSERSVNHNFICRLLSNTIIKLITLKNTETDINISYKQAETIEHRYKCFVRNLNILVQYLPVEAQRMLAADNIAGVIESLGGTKDSSKLLDIVIKRGEKRIREIEANIIYYTTLQNKVKEEDYKKELIKATQSLENLKEQIKRNDTGDCSLCCEEPKDTILTECCRGIFCGGCLKTMITLQRKECPFCRETLDLSKMIVSTKNNDEDEKSMVTCKPISKLEQLIEILKSKPNGKFIIFSEFSHTFDVIKHELLYNEISFKEVKGSVDAKARSISDFKLGVIQVLFLNSQTDGSGIDLPETTDIILYHKMSNKNIEIQVLGRALRLGRKEPLYLHRLLTEEEDVLIHSNPEYVRN